MRPGRRAVLRCFLGFAALAALPLSLLARNRQDRAFAATRADAALQESFGTAQTIPSGDIRFIAPEVAENGAMVPLSVETSLIGVRSVSIVVENNPRPLAVSFELPPGTLPSISCRIKMAETSPVTAVVETADGLYSASREVKVTLGGCA